MPSLRFISFPFCHFFFWFHVFISFPFIFSHFFSFPFIFPISFHFFLFFLMFFHFVLFSSLEKTITKLDLLQFDTLFSFADDATQSRPLASCNLTGSHWVEHALCHLLNKTSKTRSGTWQSGILFGWANMCKCLNDSRCSRVIVEVAFTKTMGLWFIFSIAAIPNPVVWARQPHLPC